jgi:glyoxylase-like metal-dependent hydrolase (beta-lactamase superfamily II)
MRALSIGSVRLYVLDDGTFPFPAHFFFRDVPEAVWRAELDVDKAGKIAVGHNYALLETEGERIVIDTGYGDDTHDGRTGHLLAELAATGIAREQITHVVITHAHGDHIKRNTLIEDGRRVPTFPYARYHLARADWDWFGGPGRVPEFDEQLVPLERCGLLALVEGRLQLTAEVTLVPTPGHTPGHTSVAIESEGRIAIFLGDLCHLPLHVTHPEWVSTFDTDPGRTPNTRAEIFALAARLDALIICPHAPSPGIGRIRRCGRGFRWEQAEG